MKLVVTVLALNSQCKRNHSSLEPLYSPVFTDLHKVSVKLVLRAEMNIYSLLYKLNYDHGYCKLWIGNSLYIVQTKNLPKRAVADLDTRATTNRTIVPCNRGWYKES